MFRQLLYTSQATIEFSEEDIVELLRKSREWNSAHGITGLLLSAHNGHFVQALEGPAKTVDEVMGRIEVDPRHTSVCKLIDQAIEKREFPSWSMGHHRLEGLISENGLLDGEQIKTLSEKNPDLPVSILSMVVNIHDANAGTTISKLIE